MVVIFYHSIIPIICIYVCIYIKIKHSYSSAKGSRKKSSSTSGRATKALPPPLELNGYRNFFLKYFFSLKIAKNGF